MLSTIAIVQRLYTRIPIPVSEHIYVRVHLNFLIDLEEYYINFIELMLYAALLLALLRYNFLTTA